MLVNHLMTGFYKIDEPIVYFSFKNCDLMEDRDYNGSLRISLRNAQFSVNRRQTNSTQKQVTNQLTLDKEFEDLVSKSFPWLLQKEDID